MGKFGLLAVIVIIAVLILKTIRECGVGEDSYFLAKELKNSAVTKWHWICHNWDYSLPDQDNIQLLLLAHPKLAQETYLCSFCSFFKTGHQPTHCPLNYSNEEFNHCKCIPAFYIWGDDKMKPDTRKESAQQVYQYLKHLPVEDVMEAMINIKNIKVTSHPDDFEAHI